MASSPLPARPLGWKASDFRLPGVDGKAYTLKDICGQHGTVVMFICNHCPYVKAIVDRLAKDIGELSKRGIGAIAIMPNDPKRQPEDSLDNMKVFAKSHTFSFPYVIDESQQTARDYAAVCTPEFFGFDPALSLQYHGRFDSSGKGPAGPETKRELFDAMLMIAETRKGPVQQVPSIGCSVKWRE